MIFGLIVAPVAAAGFTLLIPIALPGQPQAVDVGWVLTGSWFSAHSLT